MTKAYTVVPAGVVRSGVLRAGRVHRLLGLALIVMVLLTSGVAMAARVVWKRTKLKEENNTWKIAFEVHLDRAPDVNLVPVRLTFTPMTYFERALVDGQKGPVIRKVPLENQQPIVESADVGFMDPASGKTQKRTRFTFPVSRDNGFEAGEYQVKVTDARTNKDMAGATTLTFEGENEIIDRRSVVFDDSKPKPKKEEQKAAAPEQKELSPEDDAFWAGGPKEAEEKTSPLPPPAHLQEKPGCGCRTAGQAPAAGAWALGALAVAALARRRTRQGAMRAR